MINTEILIIGGGPAGLCAAISAARTGAEVIIVERDDILGGQLVKQTHMFFGSEKQLASIRGIDIAKKLIKDIKEFKNIKVMTSSTVLGIYEDDIITVESKDEYKKIKAKSIIIATGASEKNLIFPNSDLPGIYGAGAVQTLMNVYGVKPGNKVLMVGAGNIGLIVSYQLMQAGVSVEAIIDAAPRIGGYLVHASKIRRMGVPILTRHTVKKAIGNDYLEGAVIWSLDENWTPIKNSEKSIVADVMCISVGLSPLADLLWQINCEMKFIAQLGGYVPIRDENLQTSKSGVFVAGDLSSVEEASSAMVEGYLAGLSSAKYIGKNYNKYNELKEDYILQLKSLRSGPVGHHIRQGLLRTSLY